jgi:hypothetical protein
MAHTTFHLLSVTLLFSSGPRGESIAKNTLVLQIFLPSISLLSSSSHTLFFISFPFSSSSCHSHFSPSILLLSISSFLSRISALFHIVSYLLSLLFSALPIRILRNVYLQYSTYVRSFVKNILSYSAVYAQLLPNVTFCFLKTDSFATAPGGRQPGPGGEWWPWRPGAGSGEPSCCCCCCSALLSSTPPASLRTLYMYHATLLLLYVQAA